MEGLRVAANEGRIIIKLGARQFTSAKEKRSSGNVIRRKNFNKVPGYALIPRIFPRSNLSETIGHVGDSASRRI